MSNSDVAIIIDAENNMDISLSNSDFQTDGGLRTAILISLFTDRRVSSNEVPDAGASKRGWWGDLFPTSQGDQIGSRLWLLQREKRTVETLNKAEEYSREALQWMLDDGVAESVDANASYNGSGALIIQILVTRPSGNKTFRFVTNWAVESARGN